MTFKIEVIANIDELPIRGNAIDSGDEIQDKEVENEIIDRLESGDVWAWASVEVRATCSECGAHGSDYLGACSYVDGEREFRNDAYFEDMCTTAHNAARKECSC